jgi:hypothetical protein
MSAMDSATRVARAAMAAATARLPPERAEWGRAMLAELEAAESPRELLAWTAGGLATALRLRLRRPGTAVWLVGVGGSFALIGVLDWSPSDIANQTTLLALLVTAGGLGFAVPGARVATGLILGSAVAVLHVTYQLAGIQLPYAAEPAGMGGAISLLVLIVPAMVAAALGGVIRRRALS